MLLRALFTIALCFAPAAAGAASLVVGFGDSISLCDFDPFPNGCYAHWLDAEPAMGVPVDVSIVATPARFTDGLLYDIQDWLDAGNTADAAILLAGDPDTAQWPGFFGGVYSEAQTVANLALMVSVLEGAGIPAVLMAPPPVMYPCASVELGSGGALRCVPDPGNPATPSMDARLASLAAALGNVVATGVYAPDLGLDVSALAGVPFVDLYAAFQNEPGGLAALFDYGGVYSSDGLHPNVAGDHVIAHALAPVLHSVLAPEPGTLLQLGAGLAGLALAGRRRAAWRA